MAGKLTEPLTVKLDTDLDRYCQGMASINKISAPEYVRGLIEADREKSLMQFTLMAQALGQNGYLETSGSQKK